MIARSIFIAVFCFSYSLLSAQWDSYEATWEGKPGLMLVQMDLHQYHPYPELPYLLTLSQTALACDALGYPDDEFMSKSEQVLLTIDSALSDILYVEDVGRLIYQCTVTDYIYIEDTILVKSWLEEHYKGLISYRFKSDEQWKIYADFIYPDDYLRQTMINGKILKSLQEQDILIQEKKRLAHFASFKSKDDLHDYRRFLIGLNFKVDDIAEDPSQDYPHRISFSRKDRLNLEKLSNTTLRLYQRARSLEGSYEGWEITIE